ncbi:MAG: hypothetical protein AB8G17_17580 [Gammaproteobacteria bacterium]
MANSTANLISIRRRVRAFARAQRRNPERYRILAEGDSWFTTPVEGWKGPTLVESLKRHSEGGKRPFNIMMIANPSTELSSTLDSNNLDIPLATLTDWIGDETYDMVLLSTGGNDVLGTQLRDLLLDPREASVKRCLERATTPLQKARCVLNCDAYLRLLDNMRERIVRFRKDVLRPNGLGRARVLMHGYDYPIADGRDMAVLGGLVRVGPWLKPAFRAKRIPTALHAPVLKLLIDEFNGMVRAAALSQQLFHYIDLRHTLDGAQDWADEIHPHKDTGVRKISARLQQAIKQIRDRDAGSVIEFGAVTQEYRCRD